MRIIYRLFLGLLIAAVSLTAFSLFTTSGIYLLSHKPQAMDYLAFHTAAVLLFKSPSHLYDLHSQLLVQKQLDPRATFIAYVNPPFVALLFMPFVKLGLENGYGVWTGVNCILLFAISYLAYRELHQFKWYYKTFFIIGLVTFLPVLTTLLIGQLSILLTLVLLLTLLFLKKGWDFRSGLMLSLMVIKPQFLILPLVALLIQRRIKLVAGVLSGMLILGTISYFIVGINGLISFWHVLTFAYQGDIHYDPDYLAQHSLQTVLFILLHTLSPTAIRIPWLIFIALIILPTLYVLHKQYLISSPQSAFQFSLLIAATLLTSPHTHFHDLSILIVVGVILLSIINKLKTRGKKLLITLVTSGYFIELAGYLIDLHQQLDTRIIFIFVSVGYMLVLWFILLKILLNKDKHIL